MADPVKIAAEMTPAQVRALRNPILCSRADFAELARVARDIVPDRFFEARSIYNRPFTITAFGRAVLKELEQRNV